MVTLKEWINWQELQNANCSCCRYYNSIDYTCRSHECVKKFEEDEDDED